MDIVNASEHTTCFYYEQKTNPHLISAQLSQGKIRNEVVVECKVMFVTKGEVTVSYEGFPEKLLRKGEMLLLPQGSNCVFMAKSDTEFSLFLIGNLIQLCDTYSIEKLFSEDTAYIYVPKVLEMNPRVVTFLSALTDFNNDGLKCNFFFDIKRQEFQYILRLYYSRSDLMGFLLPLLKKNIEFSSFVFNNYKNVRSVKQFAQISSYSLSGFEKRFKKVFGTSAHTWLTEQKAQAIFKDISATPKLFKDISVEYEFSSPAHFNDFCKAHFGSTPGEIRRSKLKR